MPRHFSEQEKNDIRERLIEVGLELFEKYAINKVNISDLTSRVGISKGSFYTFFNSKGDLFMEIYRIEREKAHAKAVASTEKVGGNIDVMMRQYVVKMHELIKQRPILEIVYNPEALFMITDQSVRERLLAFNTEINEQIAEMVQEWMDESGSSYKIDPMTVAKMLRSIYFLRFHDFAIGLDSFGTVVDAVTSAIVEYVKNSKS